MNWQQSEPEKTTFYNLEPDYTLPLLEISESAKEKIMARLHFLYGETAAKKYILELERILKVHYAHKTEIGRISETEFNLRDRFTQKDIVLIAYGDMVRGEGSSPLATLGRILNSISGLKEIINTLHILPFFPYSSDRGFSIVDFKIVDPKLGSWQDIKKLGDNFQLMFDAVFNHVSAKSLPFQELLNGNPNYKNVFTTYNSPEELTPEQRKIIVRPRTSDILTKFDSIDGPIWVWTTFSPDQIDLNFRNPEVLLGVIETLLLYVRRGANLIRLDAVTYLWDEPGTTGANLQQTHEIIKLFRDILNIVAPRVALVTETNVPHEENISYFGNGNDEAQMVYNFALPPLVLYTFYKEDATALSNWAKNIRYPSLTTTFFNMLDTHDGVGLMGVKNILSPEERNFIIERAREHGAFVSYKTGEGGTEEPYEINTTWFSALNIDNGYETQDFQIKRFLASRSIALVLPGIPGIYLHGLIGSRSDVETVLKTKSKRDINRHFIREEDILNALKNPKSNLAIIAIKLGRLLEIRVRQSAFHPNGDCKVLTISPSVFCVLRISPDCSEHILCLTNITSKVCQVKIPLLELGVPGDYGSELANLTPVNTAPFCATPRENYWYDLVGKRGWQVKERGLELNLKPYQVAWLIPFIELEKAIEFR
ncbi:MAG: sugar phosphorylase [Prochloraceae cyanobacterium]|nr:sugar phosphorylase [Prochloraceae cyanobacterium]